MDEMDVQRAVSLKRSLDLPTSIGFEPQTP